MASLLNACESDDAKGERLAKTYCGSCHLFPDPSLLDKKIWKETVIPQMAFRMGFVDIPIMTKLPPDDLQKVIVSLPSAPMVTQEEMDLIINYYTREAPDTIIAEDRAVTDTLAHFTAVPVTTLPPFFVSLIHYDNQTKKIFIGERYSHLVVLDDSVNVINKQRLASPPSCIMENNGSQFISVMGIMDPNDQALGAIQLLGDITTTPILDSLQRPVYFDVADFNNDKKEDIVVCEFGNYTGLLSLFEQTTGGYKKHILTRMPGARKVILRDMNKDGLMDIIALLTQGDEKIALFTNNGNFDFTQTTLARFLPVFGSSYLEMADMNGDGFEDLIYTNGDNSDYSIALKNYHGIHIFLNDKKNNFNETWTYPMHGASQVAVRDFDLDGDLDMAAISFFPDYARHPEMGFIYFQHNGNLQFTPQITHGTELGKWLVMEAADYDEDGDIDIILGACNFTGFGLTHETVQRWYQDKLPTVLVLKNTVVQNN